MPDIFTNLVRLFGFVLDNVIYSLIPIIYKLFIYLSEINLFSMDESTPIGALLGRIYVFLGIFMLFKVTFSLIQYLIDPNAFSDKSKGFGKLVTNAMVTILLLVSVPFIFNYAMILQNKIVTSNAIGTLIMGNSAGEVVSDSIVDENGIRTSAKLNVNQVNEMATDLQFLMYGAFFSINPDAKIGGDTPNACATTPIFGTVAMAQNEGCLNLLKEEFENESSDMARSNTKIQDFFKIAESENPATIDTTSRNFSRFGNLLSWQDSDGQYVINYLPFVSAAAGLYIVFLLVSFSVDIAVRAIKLCFLEMIAPIAIVSYIDPKESMSNSKLKNWIKECATTYFSLFLRIATLFLVMLLISVIASSVLAQNGYISGQINEMEAGYNIWIYLFLIIGAFMFAKKVPQMIENIFGIKMSGDLSLNPFKNPFLAGALGAGIGSLAGASAGLRAGIEAGAPGRGFAAGFLGGARNGIINKGNKNLFGNTRNQLYKQLTGNEMKVFNPYQKIMSVGGQQKVDEIDKYVKKARTQLNTASSELNQASNNSAQMYNNLVNNGIDINNLAGARRASEARISSSESKIASLKNQKDQRVKSKEKAERDLERLNNQMEKLTSGSYSNEELAKFSELETKLKSQISADDSALASINHQLNNAQQSINHDSEILSNIDSYTSSLERENELRAEIGKIEKDISTLSNEKTQRKQFYGIDSSTVQDVNDAISHVEKRRN